MTGSFFLETWIGCGSLGVGDKREPVYSVEEGISIRAIKREYARLSGDPAN